MRSRWLEYTGPDDDASAELTLAFVEGRMHFGEYERRQRELNYRMAGSTPYVLFMATILPTVDWVRRVWRWLAQRG